MDYLFYGKIITSPKANGTTISLHIDCDTDETLHLYHLAPDASHRLAYTRLSASRSSVDLVATFEVKNDQIFLFVIAGQSNESDIPFEVTYAVYNGEVIALPENSIIQLEGSTILLVDGK